MAGTQVLPSWLTLVTTTVTQPDGSVQTSDFTLELPLTYYGPSIPLGTDGAWTWGGLTSPPSATIAPSTTAPSTSVPPTSITPSSSFPSPTSSSLASTSASSPASSSPSSSLTSSTPMSASSSSPAPSSTSAAASGATSHGLSNAALAAILGAILGSFFLFVLVLLFCFLRRRARRTGNSSSQGSSSFWNRQTTLFSRGGSKRQTPIWTGWEIVDPDPDEVVHISSPRTPGEGSPRGSGEEHDPFLTRRTAGTLSTTEEEMTQTVKSVSDTIVNFPPTVALVSTRNASDDSGKQRTGHILSREQILRMDDEPMPQVRVTEPTPHSTPLAPPPPLGRPPRPSNDSSDGSVREHLAAAAAPARARSPVSEKSLGSLHEQESAQLLTARRIKIGEMGQRPGAPTHSYSDSAAASAAGPSSALDRLASLGSLGWFKRFSGEPKSPPTAWGSAADPYTRTPPRTHSRPGSMSRPISWAPLPTTDPEGESSTARRRGLGMLQADSGERPVSTLSSRSATTIYHDARSRPVTPGSSQGDLTTSTRGSLAAGVPPVPAIPADQRQPSPLAQSAVRHSDGAEARESDPPSYESLDVGVALRQGEPAAQPLDVLDLPVPRPVSAFAGVAYRALPPGLDPIPKPSVWRESHPNSAESGGSSAVHADSLDDLPPVAQDTWRSIASGDSRRATFGTPVVAPPPRDAFQSEQGSLHSMRSHLSPHSRLNTSGSAPASFIHTNSGSSSSRPTAHSHSQGRSGSSGVSLAHSPSISEEDRRPRRAAVGEVPAPPVSAVFPGRDWTRGSQSSPVLAQPPLAHPSSRTPFLLGPSISGTVTSSRTAETNTSSVTTTLTDPISGAHIHAPHWPWRREREWGDIEAAHEGESGW